jgi:CRP-like cAMP-binding protein
VRRPIRPEAFLARLPLFRDLPSDVIGRLAAATARRELRRGEHLFREGEPSTGVHAVVYGRVELSHRGPDGRDRVVDIVGAGRSFGEPVMFLEKPYIVAAKALADSLILTVSKDAVFAELARSERFAARMIGALAQRAEALVRELQHNAIGTGAHRFVGWLLRQPMRAAESGAIVVLSEPKRVLAARLKLSAEHFSRVLRELVAGNLIAVRGREIVVPDVAQLRAWQMRTDDARP